MITGRIIENKFIPDSPQIFQSEFSKRNGKMVKIELKTIGYKNKQLSYLYGVVYKTFMEELGYTTLDEVDRDLKDKFFFEFIENKLTGEIQRVLKSKASAGKDELSKYISDCVQFGNTEYGFNILDSQTYFET